MFSIPDLDISQEPARRLGQLLLCEADWVWWAMLCSPTVTLHQSLVCQCPSSKTKLIKACDCPSFMPELHLWEEWKGDTIILFKHPRGKRAI